jgi:hypothetical protein
MVWNAGALDIGALARRGQAGRLQGGDRRADPQAWASAAIPFFAPRPTLLVAPRTDSNRQYQRSVLDYYLEVG